MEDDALDVSACSGSDKLHHCASHPTFPGTEAEARIRHSDPIQCYPRLLSPFDGCQGRKLKLGCCALTRCSAILVCFRSHATQQNQKKSCITDSCL